MEMTVKKREWVKNAAIIFLAVMLVLTFFSNTIMNKSLPEVATQYVQSGEITSKIRGSGLVTANGSYDVMNLGVVQQIGAPQEVFDHPANLFVAGFIGTPQMNFINTELEERRGVMCARIMDELVELPPLSTPVEELQGRACVLGIRPEFVTVAPDRGMGERSASWAMRLMEVA